MKSLLITMGDPLGIGPEVILKSLAKIKIKKDWQIQVVGSLSVFAKFNIFKKVSQNPKIQFINITKKSPKSLSHKMAAQQAYKALQFAVTNLKNKKYNALVTAPINKFFMQQNGFNFAGHTEFLCSAFAVNDHAMMIYAPQLKVVLQTIHVPLADVCKQISAQKIFCKLELLAHSLKSIFQLKNPRIAVCGLNPHAGEGGLIGHEDAKIILPAIKKFNQSHHFAGQAFGPLSADAVFIDAINGKFDAVLTMYHDQGLPVIKTLARDSGVNITLGLPFIRTSPDHGTAFDIAHKNLARAQSMQMAILEAMRLSF